MICKLEPEIVGHFDVIRIYRQDFNLSQQIWKKIERNIKEAIQVDAVFEINASALSNEFRYPYPQSDILQVSCISFFAI